MKKLYCEDCKKDVWTVVYNDDITPHILCCEDCWQFLQQ